MTKKRILLVDDDPRLRNLVKLSLGDHFDLLEADNGQAALDLVQSQRPDLVMLDVVMPGMSGIDVCGRIKQDNGARKTLVVMLTGRTAPEEVGKAMELGADAYVTKPFSPRSLLDRITELLSWE